MPLVRWFWTVSTIAIGSVVAACASPDSLDQYVVDGSPGPNAKAGSSSAGGRGSAGAVSAGGYTAPGSGGGGVTGGATASGGSTGLAGDASAAPDAITAAGGSTVDTGGSQGAGGTSSGGSTSAGGAPGTGGVTTTGGATASGGARSSGGASSTGGTQSTGGALSTGGASTGGVTASGGATGTGGASGSVTFGGAYETNGPQCTTAACYTPNPAAASTCGCPSGFKSVGPLPVLDERNCPMGHQPFGWSAVNVCFAGTFSTNADFGGVYQLDTTGACSTPNPMSSGCACPSGSQAIEVQADGSCWLNTTLGFCWNGSAPLTHFGGVYQESDTTSYGTNGCVVANPATGGCSCPSGTSPIAMRTAWGPSNSGCQNNGAAGGQLVVCAVP